MLIVTVIVTYNPIRWIDKCLSQLRKSTVPTEVVIVDNCSTDGAREYIPNAYPEVRWMPQDRNLGFGQGNNVGIRYAIENNADFVLLLNQDAYLQPDAIELMIKASDGESLLSPMHLNGSGTGIDRMFRWSLMKTIEKELRPDVCGIPSSKTNHRMLIDDLFLGNYGSSYEAAEICAACWFMPRKLLEIVGGFNPLFFHYSEDNNYYHRMVYHGMKTLLVPNAHVWHDRDLYGNVQTFNQKKLHRDVILNFCNINSSLFKAWSNFFRLFLRCYVYDLKNGVYQIGGWIKELNWVTIHFSRILKSRKQERKKNPSWL